MSKQQNDNATIREALQREFLKCAVDPVHFFRKYAKIQHPMKGKILFNLYPFQEDTLRHFRDHRFNIIGKSRQMGISTLVAGYALHCMLFNNDFKILVIATKQDVAKNLVEKVQIMHEFLPNFLKGEITNDNKLEFKFKNGSSIKAVASSPSAGRSEALSLLIWDEMAHCDGADEIWTSASLTLATGGNAILLSSPAGVGNAFHEIWQQATEGTTSSIGKFNPISLPWNLHPDRDQLWRDMQTEQLGKLKAAQECDVAFLTSGHTYIDSDFLQYHEENSIQEPVERRGAEGNLWIWKYPYPRRDYIVAADVARGDGEDFSTFQVLDVETLEQVAEFRAKVDTHVFASVLISIATEYNNALLVIDNRNIGYSTVQVVINSGYRNLYYSYKNDVYFDENIHIRKNYDLKSKEDMVPGFTTTTRNRPIMLNMMDTYMREKTSGIKSRRLLNELYVFKWIDNKPQAASGSNDDLIMAFCMAMFVRETALRMRNVGIDIMKRSIQNIRRVVYKPPPLGQNKWEQPMGGFGQKESLKWLL